MRCLRGTAVLGFAALNPGYGIGTFRRIDGDGAMPQDGGTTQQEPSSETPGANA
jgi:hypothetical protein